jgi:hypothetical protein
MTKTNVIIISLLKILQADQVQYHYQFLQINTDGFKRWNDSKNCVFERQQLVALHCLRKMPECQEGIQVCLARSSEAKVALNLMDWSTIIT